jgi:hypothetical protein
MTQTEQLINQPDSAPNSESNADLYSPKVVIEKIMARPDLFIGISEIKSSQFRSKARVLKELESAESISEYILTKLVKPEKRVKIEYSSQVIPQENLNSVVDIIRAKVKDQPQDIETTLQKIAFSLEEFNTWLERPTISEIKIQDHLDRRAWRSKMRDLLDEQSSMDETHDTDIVGPFSDLYEQNKLRGTNISKISFAIQKIAINLKKIGIDTTKIVTDYKYINERVKQIQSTKQPLVKRIKQRSLIWAIDAILFEIVDSFGNPI